MSKKINTNKGETDVKNQIIDFSALDTEDREDDKETWNSLQFIGNDDSDEARHKLSKEPSQEVLDRIKGTNVAARIFEAFKVKVA